MSVNETVNLSEIIEKAKADAMMQEKFKDIFAIHIEEIEFCLEQEHYIAALSLALTLPDICGKAEYPNLGNTQRYIQWYNQYMVQYQKGNSLYDSDMPYLSGEVVYNLRNSMLHSGNPNVDSGKIKDADNKVDRFELRLAKDFSGDTSCVAYGKNYDIVKREYTVNVYLLCYRLCETAKLYYQNNKEKFNFFNYSISVDNTELS